MISREYINEILQAAAPYESAEVSFAIRDTAFRVAVKARILVADQPAPLEVWKEVPMNIDATDQHLEQAKRVLVDQLQHERSVEAIGLRNQMRRS